ncbi:MAG: hypothetical protein Q8889_02130, partial [Candidatus Phytoplasma australasiaticum]|nr:hypothetical protein [Candidatus Phytoplasma australasiaticum]MDV3199900.1 hypothetical protein [Candidatus Phytoplasma australasiaticum]
LTESDERHDKNNQRHDESILNFDKRLKTLIESDERHDKNNQRQDEMINKVKEKTARFDPIRAILTKEKYEIQEKLTPNIINLNYKNQLIKEEDKNNHIFQKDNILSETINNKNTIDFLTYQQKNTILKQKQLSLSQKLIKLTHKYLTNIYSINIQTWIFVFKKYSQIYLLIILCMINILFYLLLRNNFKS